VLVRWLFGLSNCIIFWLYYQLTRYKSYCYYCILLYCVEYDFFYILWGLLSSCMDYLKKIINTIQYNTILMTANWLWNLLGYIIPKIVQ
jgi:hypothetical protein